MNVTKRSVLAVLLVLAGCGGTALGVEPATSSSPPTTVETPAVLAPALVITVGQHCLDGTHAVPAETVVGIGCVPWPTRCLDGERFIIPTDQLLPGDCRPSTLRELVDDEFGREAPTAAAIITCESHWNPGAVGPVLHVHGHTYHPIGLMQIEVPDGGRRNGRTAEELKVPAVNLATGHEIRDAETWHAWSCFEVKDTTLAYAYLANLAGYAWSGTQWKEAHPDAHVAASIEHRAEEAAAVDRLLAGLDKSAPRPWEGMLAMTE